MAELDGATVRLRADERLRTVSVASLSAAFADDPDPGLDPSGDQSWTVPAVVLAALSTKQRDALQRQVAVLRQVLEPPVGDDRSVAERYAAATAELGVTRRTSERQLARLREQGPAGPPPTGAAARRWGWSATTGRPAPSALVSGGSPSCADG